MCNPVANTGIAFSLEPTMYSFPGRPAGHYHCTSFLEDILDAGLIEAGAQRGGNRRVLGSMTLMP